jgi:hypothetical protein
MVMRYTAAVREADKKPMTLPAYTVRLRPSAASAMAAAAAVWEGGKGERESIGRSIKRSDSGFDAAGGGRDLTGILQKKV